MVLTQIAMVAIMTMTPIHMRAHHQSLSDVGWSSACMSPRCTCPRRSPGSGRPGRANPDRPRVGATLLAAGLIAALRPGDSLGVTVLALMLLGLGWNFGLISGTALVIDATVP